MSNKNVLFRADSSSTIGTGHIMRDLVLAEQFDDANIIFATQDLPGNINHKIKEKEYAIEILNSNDIEELDALIKELNIDMIVIDHYGIDYSFEKQLKTQNPKLKIFSLDDTYEKHYCDILLNHNIYADSSRYKNLVPEHCELRCGSEYTLLRDEFIKEKKRKKPFNIALNGNALGVQNCPTEMPLGATFNILVAMGGADHSNLNVEILKVLENFPNIHANVVTTTANQYLNELQEYVADKDTVTLHINTDKIARLMNEADVAIVSPSVTLNEIFYINIPFVAIKTANNQIEMYKYLVKNNHLALEKFNAIELKKTLGGLLHG